MRWKEKITSKYNLKIFSLKIKQKTTQNKKRRNNKIMYRDNIYRILRNIERY